MTEHIRLGEALTLQVCDLNFGRNAIYIRETIDKRDRIVPARAKSERTLAMGSLLKGPLLTWLEIQKAEFPNPAKKSRR